MKIEGAVRVVRDRNERHAVVIIVFNQNIIALRRCNLGDVVPARQFNRELGRATLSISFVVEYSIIYIVSLEQRLDDTVVDVARIMLESHGVVAGSPKNQLADTDNRTSAGHRRKAEGWQARQKGICPPEKKATLSLCPLIAYPSFTRPAPGTSDRSAYSWRGEPNPSRRTTKPADCNSPQRPHSPFFLLANGRD